MNTSVGVAKILNIRPASDMAGAGVPEDGSKSGGLVSTGLVCPNAGGLSSHTIGLWLTINDFHSIEYRLLSRLVCP